MSGTDADNIGWLNKEAAILAEARGIRLGPAQVVHKYWRYEWVFTFPVRGTGGCYGRVGKTERAGPGKFWSFAEIVEAVRADLPVILDEIEKVLAVVERRRAA